jgi:hypothetical protein
MKNKIFTILTIIAALSAMTIAATAQTTASRMADFKRGITVEINRGASPQPAGPAKPFTDEGARAQPLGPTYEKKNALAGTWDVVLTFGDGSEVKSTLQIMPGAGEGEGSAIHASMFSLAPPSPTLPEQGSWRYVRGDQFIASYYGYSFDEQLQPFGKIGFRHSITLGNDQSTFTGQAVFEVIDLDGNILFTDNCTTKGVRQRAVAP